MPFWQGCIVSNYLLYISNGTSSTIVSTSTSKQLEQAKSMKCSVSKLFEISATSNLQNEIMPILNGTFELNSDDMRLIPNKIYAIFGLKFGFLNF